MGKAATVVLACGIVTFLVLSSGLALYPDAYDGLPVWDWFRLAVMTTLLAWFGPATVLFALSLAIDDDVSLADALVVAAWGLGPTLCAWLVAFVVLSAVPGAEGAPTPAGAGAAVVVATLSVPAVGWAGYVWRSGIAQAFDLERSASTRIAASVAILALALVLTVLAGPFV